MKVTLRFTEKECGLPDDADMDAVARRIGTLPRVKASTTAAYRTPKHPLILDFETAGLLRADCNAVMVAAEQTIKAIRSIQELKGA